MAAPSTASSSKQPDISSQTGFRPQVNMTVQPPRQEDLQQSYASIVGNDASPKGWYGSMSMLCARSHPRYMLYCVRTLQLLTKHHLLSHSQLPRRLHGNSGCHPLLYLLPESV